MCTPGCVLDVCAKNEGDRANGLGGVSDWTDTQTDRVPYAINNDIISFVEFSYMCVLLDTGTESDTVIMLSYIRNLRPYAKV